MPEFLDPAEVPSEGPAREQSGRDRLVGALLRPSVAQISVAVLLAVVGFSAVTEVRTNELENTYAGRREQDLIDILTGLTGTEQQARDEIDRLEDAQEQLQSDTSARRTAIEQAAQRLQTLNILAGVVPVTGPGIRVTIEEDEGRASINSLLDTIQELRNAGAEAIEFNDTVRLAAQSWFEDTVGGVVVDGVTLEPPYVLDVIGPPAPLHGSLTFLGGPLTELEDDGTNVSILEYETLDIESVRQAGRPEFAEPQEGQ